MINIKQIESKDWQIIQDLAFAIWPKVYKNIVSTEQLYFMLGWKYSQDGLIKSFKDGHLFYLAIDEISQKPLGFCSIEHNCGHQHHTKVHKIYVLPDHHKKGIGYQLLSYVKNEAIMEEADLLFLNVNKDNPAIEFYKRFGLEITSSEVIEIGQRYVMDDYVMAIHL